MIIRNENGVMKWNEEMRNEIIISNEIINE